MGVNEDFEYRIDPTHIRAVGFERSLLIREKYGKEAATMQRTFAQVLTLLLFIF